MPGHRSRLVLGASLAAEPRLHRHANQRRDAGQGADQLHRSRLLRVDPLRGVASPHVVCQAQRGQLRAGEVVEAAAANWQLAVLAEDAFLNVSWDRAAAAVLRAAQQLCAARARQPQLPKLSESDNFLPGTSSWSYFSTK